MSKRNKVWPLTRREAAIIKSLDDIFVLSWTMLIVVTDEDYDGNKKRRVADAMKRWRRAIDRHCKRFAGEADWSRELRGAYQTLGLARHRMRRAERS